MPNPLWELRLYIAGRSAKAVAALSNLQHICDERLVGKYRIEVIDLLRNPALGRGDRDPRHPDAGEEAAEPGEEEIIGDLSNAQRVLVGLDIKEL